MMFAFSRDGALPKFFDYVHPKFQTPIRTIWLAATLAFILALPSLGSSVAFAAATDIATIGLYISYGIPILIGLIYSASWERGPFKLGRASRPVAFVAVAWIAFITIVFCLPEVNPVTSQTLNYTPIAVGIIAVWAFGSWILWARRWFVGPIGYAEADVAQVHTVSGPDVLEEEKKDGSSVVEKPNRDIVV